MLTSPLKGWESEGQGNHGEKQVRRESPSTSGMSPGSGCCHHLLPQSTKALLGGLPLEAAVTHGLLRTGLPRAPRPRELCVPAAPLAALQTLHECFLESVRKTIWEVSLQASSPFPENEKEGCRGGSH